MALSGFTSDLQRLIISSTAKISPCAMKVASRHLSRQSLALAELGIVSPSRDQQL